jgi:hypothetical protein
VMGSQLQNKTQLSEWDDCLFYVLALCLLLWWQYMEFRIIFSLQYSISIDTCEVDLPSDSLHNALVKPKNSIPGNVLHDTARWMYEYRSVGLFHIMLVKMLYSLICTCAQSQRRSPLFIQTVYLGFISFYILATLDCCVFIIYYTLESWKYK